MYNGMLFCLVPGTEALLHNIIYKHYMIWYGAQSVGLGRGDMERE